MKVAEDHLLNQGWADAALLRNIRDAAALEVEQAVAQAQREPGPDVAGENWCALASRHLSERFETPDTAA